MSHDRRPAKSILAAGLLLLAVCVGGFVHYARRDTATLRHGERVPGEVVAKIGARGWDFMDSGRIVVVYTLDGVAHRDAIYIDSELDEYDIGEEVTVVVRGEHVRTVDEPNDPAPIGLLLILLGLAGLGFLGWGITRLLPAQAAALEPPQGAIDRIALVTWRLAPRKAVLDVLPGELSLFLPGVFGRRRMVMPVAGTGVAPVDLGIDQDWADEETADGLFFKEGVRIADLPSASVVKSGNLLLLFQRPVRVPPLRWVVAWAGNIDLPFSARETRSAEGASVDGVWLRAVDPVDARARLVRAGVTPIEQPFGWLAEHRELETDPAAQAEIIAEVESVERLLRWQSIGYGAGFVLLIAGRILDDFRLAGAGLAAWAVTFAVGWLRSRRLNDDSRA